MVLKKILCQVGPEYAEIFALITEETFERIIQVQICVGYKLK